MIGASLCFPILIIYQELTETKIWKRHNNALCLNVDLRNEHFGF